jgi:hypothetical protein
MAKLASIFETRFVDLSTVGWLLQEKSRIYGITFHEAKEPNPAPPGDVSVHMNFFERQCFPKPQCRTQSSKLEAPEPAKP